MSGRKLIVKRRSHRATLPKRATEGSAGYDLYSAEACLIGPGERRIVATDISVKVPEDTYGRIAPRSGLAVKNGINVLAGVIDSDFRGAVGVVLVNHSNAAFSVEQGDRIGQLILEVCKTPEVEEAEELDETTRGEGGFGSTGGNSLNSLNPSVAEAAAEAEAKEVEDVEITNSPPQLPLLVD